MAQPGKNAHGITISPCEAAEADALPVMTSTREVARLIGKLADLIADTLHRQLSWAPPDAASRARQAVADFFALYPRRPVLDNSGGSGFNDSLWLFALARALRPELIVESGTHRGHSAWLFRQACPEAEIHSFDIAPDRKSVV